MKRITALLLLLFLSLQPLSAQDDDDDETSPYFSLSTQSTFRSGTTPAVELWAAHVRSLEFRVYKINDPVVFFQNLKDPHRFGGQAPRTPRQRTGLEKLHAWKREWRDWFRDFFRFQFSSKSRAEIREWSGRRSREKQQAREAQVEYFASVPLLNDQQLVARWKQSTEPGPFRWRTQRIPIEVKDKGVYLVEATDGELQAYTVVIVTDIALVSQTSPGHLTAFVADRVTGKPQAGAIVRYWDKDKKVVELRANESGIVHATFEGRTVEELYVTATTGSDFAVMTPYSWLLNVGNERGLAGYAYTDRPVYRPGDTVHYKAILRSSRNGGYALPEVGEAHLQLRDGEYKSVFEKQTKISASGTVIGEYVIPANSSLGDFTLQVGDGGATASFYVEEYKKPEYTVKVTPTKPRVLQGEPITAVIDSRYYFGEPVANAKVTYVVHRSVAWWYRDEEEEGDAEAFGEGGYDEGGGEYDYAGEQEQEHTGTLDAEGRLTVTIPTRVDTDTNSHNDFNYRIEARVTDEGNREISGRAIVLATYSTYRLNVIPNRYSANKGDTITLNVTAEDYDGKPVQTAFSLEARQYDVKANQYRGLSTLSGATDANGSATLKYTITTTGDLDFRAVSQGGNGREVVGRGYLWVSGYDYGWSGERNQQVIKIVPDQKKYKPGDTAHIAIVAPVKDAHILVMTDTGGIETHQVFDARDGLVNVDVPITNASAPNFLLTALYLNDNQVFQSSKSISVPPDERRLNVEIETSKPQYQPGEAAVFNVKITDWKGNPVAGEFSLGVVDEAIYAIHPDIAGDIVNAFYGKRYSRSHIADSLSYWFTGEAGKRRMKLAGGADRFGRRHALADIKPERLVEPKIRKAFPDTTFWVADLRTGADGRAQARFNFPDSLTTWRATVRAVTADTRVGSVVSRVIVRKNLMVRLVVPRFFRRGDEVTVSTIVHNYLTTAKTARVSLAATGLSVLSGATRDLSVPSRGEIKVDWRLKADTSAMEAKLLTKALTNEESDAMELALPINAYGVRIAKANAGSIPGGSGDYNGEVNFPQQIDPNSRTLRIGVTPSIAGAMFNALDYLTRFPYGCTEQTMSSFLPNLVVARALKDLNLKSNVNQAELDKKIKAGIERLYDYQHETGGWGWWKTDDDHYFMTAYVLAGLSEAKTFGYAVDADRIANAQRWMRSAFERESRANVDLRAYAVFSLVESGIRDSKLTDTLWEQRSDLTPYGKAMLGLAMQTLGDGRASQLADEVETGAKSDDTEAHWELHRDPMLDFADDNSAEATAYALRFLARARPKSPILPKAALWLVNHRNEGYYWTTTKQTAIVLYGLTEYLRVSGELNPTFSVEVMVNDKPVLRQAFTPASATAAAPPEIVLRGDQIPSGSRIRIRKTGEGRLYWSTRAEWFSMEDKIANTGSLKLSLSREYFRLVQERAGKEGEDRIVYRLEPLTGSVRVGDVIAVREVITGGDWKYLMVEDPIPAGTEFVERDDLYELRQKPAWWEYWWTRREFHDDRMAMFLTYFKNKSEAHYLLKVVNPGKFKVSPARVGPMYQPNVMATSDGVTLDVQ